MKNADHAPDAPGIEETVDESLSGFNKIEKVTKDKSHVKDDVKTVSDERRCHRDR